MSFPVYDPEVYGEPVYNDALIDPDVYGEVPYVEETPGQANADVATGTGTALAAGTSATSHVGLATAIGEAHGVDIPTGIANASANVGATQQAAAAGVGAAWGATFELAAESAFADVATGTGTAFGVSSRLAAGVATGTGAAFGMLAAVKASAGVASGTGDALGALANLYPAGVATGSGAAYGATVITVEGGTPPQVIFIM